MKEARPLNLHFVGKRYYTIPDFREEAKLMGVQRTMSFYSLNQVEWGDKILLAQFTNTSKVKRKKAGSATVFGYFTVTGIAHNLPPELSEELHHKLRVRATTQRVVYRRRWCGEYTEYEIANTRCNLKDVIETVKELLKDNSDSPNNYKWFIVGEYERKRPPRLYVVPRIKFRQGVIKMNVEELKLGKLKDVDLEKQRVNKAHLVRIGNYKQGKRTPERMKKRPPSTDNRGKPLGKREKSVLVAA